MKLPAARKLDGTSFLGRIKGGPGPGREWIYVELNGHRYLRNDRWKLTGSGELYDMKEAPFKEALIPADSAAADVVAARKQLGQAMDNLLGKDRKPDEPGKLQPGNAVNPDKAARRARRAAHNATNAPTEPATKPAAP